MRNNSVHVWQRFEKSPPTVVSPFGKVEQLKQFLSASLILFRSTILQYELILDIFDTILAVLAEASKLAVKDSSETFEELQHLIFDLVFLLLVRSSATMPPLHADHLQEISL